MSLREKQLKFFNKKNFKLDSLNLWSMKCFKYCLHFIGLIEKKIPKKINIHHIYK